MKKVMRKVVSVMLSLSLAIGGISISETVTKAVNRSKPWLLSENRPAYASSANGGDVATFATDGKLATQWGAAANLADQWLDVDLGGKADISKVVINWQNNASYGVAYQILVSDDEINWTKVYETTNGNGGSEQQVLRDDGTVDYTYYQDSISTDGTVGYKLTQEKGRYVRILINYSKSQSGSSDKKTGWGASIREVEIYGIGDEDCNEPVSDAENIALGKKTEATSYATPWWASAPMDGSNAVDGNYDTYWLSEGEDNVQSKCNQSLTVDLGAKYTIGRVFLQWQVEYGNIWDLQVSEDGTNFKTIYRQLQGNGEDEDIRCYVENVRYARDKLIDALKKIMQNWLTYGGEEDYPYYMYYHTSWGAVSGDGGDHGMAINLSDHHFLWAYFIFPAAVLASYDDAFVEDYGEMIELLIRDCMNPDKDDDMLPFMRNFDVYEGHSWAGGYGDNNSGNNQESASEATFGWAGLYLWGLVTGNEKYEEAGIWGYTSEVNAIEQYWFNVDKGTENDSHNWAPDYGVNVYGDSNVNSIPYIGMVWGLGYTNGTYFSGNPCCIMGIHMLPVTPAITYMGYDKDTADRIWTEYEQVQEAYQKKVAAEGNSDPEGWYHILWPYMSLSDAEGAAERWSQEYQSHLNENGDYVGGVLSTDEMFNSYWYIQNMCAKGNICTDIWSSNYTSYQVFEKTVNGKTTYSAQVWNPSDETITVNFVNAEGNLGSATVPKHALVSVDPTKNEDKTKDTEYVPYESRDKVNTVPGVIEAEDYDTNFGCEPTTGEEEGGYIGWIDDGDSLVYNLEVEEEADYVVEYRVQCTDKNKNSAIRLKTDNDADYILTTNLDNTTTDWKNVKSEQTIHLKAGSYQMKLLLVDGGFNFNYIKIYKEGTKPPVAPTDDLTMADLSDYPEISLTDAQVIDVSSEQGDNTGDKIIDKNYDSRWESLAADPQYLTMDLGRTETIGGIKIYWETAASKSYVIETSSDNKTWTTVFTRTNGNGGLKNGDENRSSGLESISLTKVTDARYVRIYSTERVGGYGVSIWEVRLYGRGADQKEQLDAPNVTAILSSDKITVNWNAVENAEHYIVYRTSPTATKTKVATVTGTSYEDTSLNVSGKYTYYVVAVPAADSENYVNSAYSQASNSITYNKPEPSTTEPVEQTTEPITIPDETTTSVTEPQETTKSPDTTNKNEETTTSNQKEESSVIVKNGTKFKVGKLVYRVKNTKKKTVQVVSTVSKKVKKVSVPKKVTYQKVSYKVVAIGNNAFKNRRKLTKVTIGANVRTIGKKAFYNCKKLKKVIIKSQKLKKVGKQAFRKVNKKVFVKIPKGMKKSTKKC